MAIRRGIREAALAFAAALAVTVLFATLGDTPFLRSLETGSLDLRFRLRGSLPPDDRVALIMVDDKSLAALGAWPLSRHLFAQAVDRLDRAGAKVIAFDMLFTEADRTVPASLRAAAAAVAADASASDALRQQLATIAGDDPDADFAAAMTRSGKVLLPFSFAFTGPPEVAPDDLSDAGFQSFVKTQSDVFQPKPPLAMRLPIEALRKAAAGLAHVSQFYDYDSVPREDYAAIAFSGDYYPSIPVRAAATVLDIPWAKVGLALGEGIRLGSAAVPTDTGMRYLIDYRGPPRSFPTYSFADFLAGLVPDAAFHGRTVFIGGSFTGNADSAVSPFTSTQMPGTERLANALATILDGSYIQELSPEGMLAARAVLLGFAVLTGVFAALLPTRLAVLGAIVPFALWASAAQLAFVRGLWLPLAEPAMALTLAGVSALLFRYWVVDRHGRYVKATFQRYLSPSMVEILAADPDRVALGGETRTMSFMFCDIRGFTTISEQFKSNPHGLTHLINRFLTPMTDIILEHGGTIDKYMGDCIMAFWNAPLDDPAHADHACAAALAMTARLTSLNEELGADAEAENRPHHPIRIGIGINSGDCVVGNMGSDQRFDYSVLGDAVNLASRLEGQSKSYGVDIVLGEATRALAPDWAALELDLIAVKGKREAVRIYALMGDATLAGTDEFRALAAARHRVLDRYRAQDWDAAEAALDDCRRAAPQIATLHDLFAERIAQYRTTPPGQDWGGVHVALAK